MSTLSATLLALALYTAALLPLALVAVKPRSARAVATLFALAVVATSATNVGWVRLSSLTPIGDVQVPIRTPDDRCDQILDLLKEAGVISGISPSGELAGVDETGWEQLPPPVRDVATACAERRRAEPDAGALNVAAPPDG